MIELNRSSCALHDFFRSAPGPLALEFFRSSGSLCAPPLPHVAALSERHAQTKTAPDATRDNEHLHTSRRNGMT
jgi:hypothetical protein